MSFYYDMWEKLEETYRNEFSSFIAEVKRESNMREVIFIGRAGQGVWTLGELLCATLIETGKYAKTVFAMPGDRRASLARMYIRYSDRPAIFPSSYIYTPDEVVICDASLMEFQSVLWDYDVPALLRDMGRDSTCLINTTKSFKELGLNCKGRVGAVDATSIAIDLLGSPDHINTPLLGAYISATQMIRFEEFEQAIRRYHNPRGELFFSGKRAEKNIQAARMGYENFNYLEGCG